MSDPLQLKAFFLKYVARSVEIPEAFTFAVWMASMGVAEFLTLLLDSRIAIDINRLKESELKGREAATLKKVAEANEAQAQARIRAAEAVEAENRITLKRRAALLKKAEMEQMQAHTMKVVAEANAIDKDAETRRIEAQARLLQAISDLRQQGGELAFDTKNLRDVLGEE